MALNGDVVVVGAGVIGLCIATSLARRGVGVILVSQPRNGEASPAAAGMLAPSVERASGPAHDFAIAARDLYPDWLNQLAGATGISVPLNRLGILQIAITERGVKGLRKAALPSAEWLDREELSRIEPALGHGLGAVLNPIDGAVDIISMLRALNAFVSASRRVTKVDGHATQVLTRAGGMTVVLGTGEHIHAGRAVLAPGAWGATLGGAGAPCLRSIVPVRGQLVAFPPVGIRHVVYGPRGYLVPREHGATIAGSTMENVGFDASTTPEGIAKVRSAAEEIAPVLSATTALSAWAGLRPVTPDALPLLGAVAESPLLIYACGHSRNGILLAPLTGEAVSSLVAGPPTVHDLSQFRPDRF